MSMRWVISKGIVFRCIYMDFGIWEQYVMKIKLSLLSLVVLCGCSNAPASSFVWCWRANSPSEDVELSIPHDDAHKIYDFTFSGAGRDIVVVKDGFIHHIDIDGKDTAFPIPDGDICQ